MARPRGKGSITVEHAGTQIVMAIVRLTGTHDRTAADGLRQALGDGLEGADGIVVDLSEAPTLDAVLVEVVREACARGIGGGKHCVVLGGRDPLVRSSEPAPAGALPLAFSPGEAVSRRAPSLADSLARARRSRARAAVAVARDGRGTA